MVALFASRVRLKVATSASKRISAFAASTSPRLSGCAHRPGDTRRQPRSKDKPSTSILCAAEGAQRSFVVRLCRAFSLAHKKEVDGVSLELVDAEQFPAYERNATAAVRRQFSAHLVPPSERPTNNRTLALSIPRRIGHCQDPGDHPPGGNACRSAGRAVGGAQEGARDEEGGISATLSAVQAPRQGRA